MANAENPEHIESDLKKILPEEDPQRRMTLVDGREVYIGPIKMRAIPRWTALFMKLASLADLKDGKVSTEIELTPETFAKFANMIPGFGDELFGLMEPCLKGATPDDIDQDDAFDVIGRFMQVNLSGDFLGKAMALAGGARG